MMSRNHPEEKALKRDKVREKPMQPRLKTLGTSEVSLQGDEI